MEYCSIVWMLAAPSHLARLDRVQARAIQTIALMFWLPSLALRRMVAALCVLYKMDCPDAHPVLKRMLPPQQPQHQTVVWIFLAPTSLNFVGPATTLGNSGLTKVVPILDTHAPLRHASSRPRQHSPWVNEHLFLLIRRRNHAHRKWLQSKCQTY